MNKVAARFADGRVVKGTTLDFSPSKHVFHVTEATRPLGTNSMPIHTIDLKALFFVKSLVGDPEHVEKNEFDSAPSPGERRICAAFRDGEILKGTTADYSPGLPGFFLVPADPESNIERCYVVASATKEVNFV